MIIAFDNVIRMFLRRNENPSIRVWSDTAMWPAVTFFKVFYNSRLLMEWLFLHRSSITIWPPLITCTSPKTALTCWGMNTTRPLVSGTKPSVVASSCEVGASMDQTFSPTYLIEAWLKGDLENLGVDTLNSSSCFLNLSWTIFAGCIILLMALPSQSTVCIMGNLLVGPDHWTPGTSNKCSIFEVSLTQVSSHHNPSLLDFTSH